MSGEDSDTRSAIFTSIWRKDLWQGTESRSGPGSGVARTAPLRAALEALLDREQPRLFYDAPCGDFVWMQHVRMPEGTHYLGADIVAPMIADTESRFGAANRTFRVADIVSAPPPPADMWLCREALFHLTLEDALAVVAHWRASAIPMFLANTSPTVTDNADITTGDWRPLNLERPPFNLGPATEYLPDGAPTDPHKCVGVWRL
ncbi:class I SAM-dependent methyltransferase [Terricaulis silvestris]|uniref:Class I SAM-dependent methyltransferase n=1 Tax=Terricaulis silvestris TaxID=2686094 RepID=A0A6I6MQ65_9CAUL|nr:class I SAM-dependent methyltransferase [Terricaulis silvestris]QGZ95548.1 hypothetical protein DSM104635_02398 [Terricaulis silvestris]